MQESAPPHKNIKELHNSFASLFANGQFIEALALIQQIVEILHSSPTHSQEQLDDAHNTLAQALNAAGMMSLQINDLQNCGKYLKRAQSLNIKTLRTQATTLNNLGCYYRRINKLSTALQYLQRSLNLQLRLKHSSSLSETYTNICTVLSLMEMHDDAVYNAMMSVILLQHDMLKKVMGNQQDMKQVLTNDKLNKLAIGYYNSAVEFQHLKKIQQAQGFYDKAVEVANNTNFTNARLLAKMQKAKKKFETTVKQKADALRNSKVSRLKTEIQRDTFYKNLQDSIRKHNLNTRAQKHNHSESKPSAQASVWHTKRSSQDMSVPLCNNPQFHSTSVHFKDRIFRKVRKQHNRYSQGFL